MPGPVSDSYDPEFGTGANAQDVKEKIIEIREWIDRLMGKELKDIVQVVREENLASVQIVITERELRIIRFCLIRALESI